MNPIASDQTHLRTTLIPGIWKNVADNTRYFDEFRLFEIGVEIHKRTGGELPHRGQPSVRLRCTRKTAASRVCSN